MSDEPDNEGNGAAAPVAGELLAKARVERDISIEEIAKELHLDESKVQALEQNRFDSLGAPVFAKGYLRKYAGLVGVGEDDVIADYYRLNRSAGIPPLVTKRAPPLAAFNVVPWIGAGVVVVLAVVGVAWFAAGGTDESDESAELGAAPAEGPAAADEGPRSEPLAEPAVSEPPAARSAPAVEAAETESTTATGVREAAPPTSRQAEPAAAADGHLGLRLAFSGDCWTEVTDANGRRLYFGLGRSGNAVTVSGEPPLNVLLGDSENVAVFVDGAAYPIPASARRGETARLTLTAR